MMLGKNQSPDMFHARRAGWAVWGLGVRELVEGNHADRGWGVADGASELFVTMLEMSQSPVVVVHARWAGSWAGECGNRGGGYWGSIRGTC